MNGEIRLRCVWILEYGLNSVDGDAIIYLSQYFQKRFLAYKVCRWQNEGLKVDIHSSFDHSCFFMVDLVKCALFWSALACNENDHLHCLSNKKNSGLFYVFPFSWVIRQIDHSHQWGKQLTWHGQLCPTVRDYNVRLNAGQILIRKENKINGYC